MSTVQTTPTGIIVPLTKPFQKKFLGGRAAAGIECVVQPDTEVFFALTGNTPFPNRPIQLSEIAAKASAGSEGITFANGGGTAAFKASTRVAAGMAVYPDPQPLLRDIGLGDDISPGLQLTRDPKSNYILLRWGYEIGGSAKGGVVFGGPASASATAGGKSEGVFAIVRQLPKDTGAATAVYETAQSWLLPLQIASVDDLEPGTWIIAEVDSSVAVGIEAQYGFDFNWVKETEALGLSGDIGLRLQLGAKAAFGFQAGGRFAVVVSRDSVRPQDKRIRIRLFKQRQNGWNFALDAQVAAQADVSKFLPPDSNDFVKAVLGVHGAQVLRDLEEWTNPNTPVSNLVAQLSTKYLKKFVKDTTGVDPEQAFDQAKGTLKTWLDKWNQLDHAVAALLWKEAEKKANLTKIRAFNNKLREANADKARTFLRKEIEKVDFFQSLGGQLLLALLPDENLLSALTDNAVFKKVQDGANKAAAILDGSAHTNLLVNLQNHLNKRLHLDQIEKFAEDTDLETLDEMLRLKLARFLDAKVLEKPRVREIRSTIHLLLSKQAEFYQKAQQALNRQYGFGFQAAYQKNTTRSALLDLTIDTSKTGAGALIRQALLGQFDKILAKPTPGVILHEGALTHGVRVHSAVDITLPFFKGSSLHLNNSLANAKAIDEAEGRVFLYDLKATDTVVDNREQTSALTVGGHFRTAANSVRVHDAHPLSYAYSFQQFRLNMKAADLRFQVKPYIQAYLSDAFGEKLDPAVDAWVAAIEQEAARLAPANAAGTLGNTLLYLEVNLPAPVASAWLKAPKDKNALQYSAMSRNIQRRMRQLIPLYYFQDVNNFKSNPQAASALLAYSAIFPATGFREESGGKFVTTDTGTYWNWPDKKMQQFVVAHPRTKGFLRLKLEETHALLKASPGMDRSTLALYDPANVDKFVSELLNRIGKRDEMFFHSLFYTEATVIQKALDAGLAMAAFLEKSSREPARAVKLLSEFGANITAAFNKQFISVFGDGAVRPLGTMLFLEAAQAFAPTGSSPEALLNLTVLKPDSTFKPDQRTRPGTVPPAAVLLQRQLLGM